MRLPPAAIVYRTQFRIEFLISATLPEEFSHVKIRLWLKCVSSHTVLIAGDVRGG
jgi:hypothetical protein